MSLQLVQGHVAAGLEEFRSLLPNSGSIALASAASTFFPGKDNWKTRSEAFLLHDASDIDFLTHCMVSLKTFVMSNGLLIQVQGVKSKLHQKFVLYNEDHHPNHVVCYCPQFYMRSILTTWDDPATFESLQGSPKHWQQEMLKHIPSKLFRRYAWAINSTADLPRGTVFLK